MRHFLFAALATVPFGLAADSPADHPEIRGALNAVDAWIESVQIYDDVPGISVGVVFDQDLIFSKGYGYANVRRKRPADADTIYSICSISKLFTGIAVMQMRDAGKLTLRDPVSEHLDWFNIKQAHTEAGPARILGLLTHSSGLPREVDLNYWVGDGFPFPTREEMITKLAEQQTLYPADTIFQYSNLALTLAGEIAAEAAGQPYAEYVQQAILDPLGMTDTRPYFPDDLHGKQMAIGYGGKYRKEKRSVVDKFDTRAIAPAAGFTSTVNDLAKFASWQFRTTGGQANEVLAPNTLREMHRVHWVDPDWETTWGIGFLVREIEGTTVVGHGGGCPGYITQLALVPKYKLAAIVLTNAGDGPAGKVAAGILQTLGAAASGLEEPAKFDATLTDYEGNYGGSSLGGESAIRAWGDKLVVVRIPSDEMTDLPKLKRVEGDHFVRLNKDDEEREAWVFQRNEDGEVVSFHRHGLYIPKI